MAFHGPLPLAFGHVWAKKRIRGKTRGAGGLGATEMNHLAFLTARSRCFVASPLMFYKRAWLCLKTEHSRSQCELPPGVGGVAF